MRVIVSLYMWAVWLLGGLVGIPVMLLGIALLPRPKAYRVCQVVSRVILTLSGIRVRARGLEQIDFGRPHFVMANHVNLLDPFFFALVMPVPFNGVEKKENFKLPLYGWLVRRWGNVPIDRGNLEQAKRDLALAAKRMHDEGLWTIIMPEGTRTRDGRVRPFKKGGFHLALETGVPIVPVTMNGAYEIQARGSFWARPGVIEFVFGEPVDPKNYSVERLDEFIHDVRAAILGPFTGPKAEGDLAPPPALVEHGAP